MPLESCACEVVSVALVSQINRKSYPQTILVTKRHVATLVT